MNLHNYMGKEHLIYWNTSAKIVVENNSKMNASAIISSIGFDVKDCVWV